MVNKKINIISILILLIGVSMVSAGTFYKIDINYNKKVIIVNSVDKLTTTDEINNIYGDYKIKVYSNKENIIYERNFLIPNIVMSDEIDPETGDIIGGGMTELEKLDFSILIPFNENAEKIEIYDENNELVGGYLINQKESNKNVIISIIFIVILLLIVIGYKVIRKFYY